MAKEGVRVLRGPDWNGEEEDGGEGHLGTVVKLMDDHRVRVLWDHGEERVYRAGINDKYDLRIFDSAPVGELGYIYFFLLQEILGFGSPKDHFVLFVFG